MILVSIKNLIKDLFIICAFASLWLKINLSKFDKSESKKYLKESVKDLSIMCSISVKNKLSKSDKSESENIKWLKEIGE
jgi:hypothetical protein